MRLRISLPIAALLGAFFLGTVVAVPAARAQASVDSARASADAAGQQADAERQKVANINADANRLADELNQRMREVEQLDEQISVSERNAASAEGRIAELKRRFQERALILYRQAGMSPLDLDQNENLEGILDELRVRYFAERTTDQEREDVNELRAVSEQLRDEQARLAGLRKGIASERDRLNAANREIQDKLAAARAAQQRADSARTAQLAALKDAEGKARASGNAAAARDIAGRRAAVDPGPARTVGGIRCPIAGPVSFRNDWGDARSGGRRHAGTDMFSPEGTPNVAVIGGSVFTQVEGVGGLSVYLQGEDGNTYYYTHLSRFGATGSVSAGQVVGYTGGTGNANGVVHTHFEIRIGGPNGSRVNPYPTLAAVC